MNSLSHLEGLPVVAEHGQLVVKSAVAHLHDLDDDLKTPSLFLAKV